MAGPSFVTTFGGSVLYPAQSTYNNLALTQNIQLLWPTEFSIAGSPVVADIMDISAVAGGLVIQFSDATQASTGYTALFNNVGAQTITIENAGGGVLATVASGQAWLIYLADNSTVNGTWRIFQMGAGASSANAAALAGAGLVAITTTLNAFVAIQTHAANYVSVVGDRAQALEWTGGVGSFTLPNAATAGTGWFVYVKNAGSGTLTVSPPSGTIDSQASLAMAPNVSAIVVCDGANYFTVGLGQAVNSVFNFISINLTGQSSPFTLSGTQLNRVAYQFTGVLTGNMVIVVPGTTQQYWVDNETTGAFSLSLESPTPGTITAVAQGTRNILYCDGTNVVPAVTFGSTGFINGSAAVPSIFFTASPTTGFFSPGANQVAVATNGVQRVSVDATGHWVFAGPDTAAVGYVLNQSPAGPSVTAKITSPFSSAAVSPLLQIQSTAVNGFATLSICGNSATPGTGDFALFSDGTGNAAILNRSANGFLNIEASGAGGSVNIQVNGNTVATFLPAGVASAQIGSASANSIAFTNITANAASSGGATALPANPQGYLTVLVNGSSAHIPYYL